MPKSAQAAATRPLFLRELRQRQRQERAGTKSVRNAKRRAEKARVLPKATQGSLKSRLQTKSRSGRSKQVRRSARQLQRKEAPGHLFLAVVLLLSALFPKNFLVLTLRAPRKRKTKVRNTKPEERPESKRDLQGKRRRQLSLERILRSPGPSNATKSKHKSKSKRKSSTKSKDPGET